MDDPNWLNPWPVLERFGARADRGLYTTCDWPCAVREPHIHLACGNSHAWRVIPGGIVCVNDRGDTAVRCELCGGIMRRLDFFPAIASVYVPIKPLEDDEINRAGPAGVGE